MSDAGRADSARATRRGRRGAPGRRVVEEVLPQPAADPSSMRCGISASSSPARRGVAVPCARESSGRSATSASRCGRGSRWGWWGPNGSGKTTLLRIIGGLIKPDQGTVRVRGTVAPLIALGGRLQSGAHRSGEHSHQYGRSSGSASEQIAERFDDVVEFAEIGGRSTPRSRTYSSGMAARLGFRVRHPHRSRRLPDRRSAGGRRSAFSA